MKRIEQSGLQVHTVHFTGKLFCEDGTSIHNLVGEINVIQTATGTRHGGGVFRLPPLVKITAKLRARLELNDGETHTIEVYRVVQKRGLVEFDVTTE